MPTFVVSSTVKWQHNRKMPPCAAAVWRDSLDGAGYWTVEIRDLDALLAFSEVVGYELVIKRQSNASGDLPEVEIYDGYRE